MRFISIFPQKYERINLTTNSQIFIKDVEIKKKQPRSLNFTTHIRALHSTIHPNIGVWRFPPHNLTLEIQCWRPHNSEKQRPKNVRIVGKKCFYVSPKFFQQLEFDSLKFFFGRGRRLNPTSWLLSYTEIKEPNEKVVS